MKTVRNLYSLVNAFTFPLRRSPRACYHPVKSSVGATSIRTLLLPILIFIAALTAASGAGAQTAKEYFESGIKAQRAGNLDQALADYTKVIQLRPDVGEAYYNRSLIYTDREQFDLAIADLGKSIEQNPKDAKSYFLRGFNYWKTKKDDLAIADFTKAIELDPANAQSYLYRGRSNVSARRAQAAIADFTKAVAADPRLIATYEDRARQYTWLDLHDLAIADYTKIVEIDPRNSGAYSGRAWAYISKKQYDLAIADHTKAIELIPTEAYAYAGRGRAYIKAGKLTPAVEDYRKAIQLDPDNRNYYYDRAGIYRTVGLYELALEDFNKAAAMRSTGNVRYEIALTHLCAGKNDLALRDFTTYIEHIDEKDLYEKDAVMLGYIALRRLRKPAEAAAFLEKWKKFTVLVWSQDLAFLQGRLTAAKFLAAMENDVQRTHARTLIGEMSLIAGNPAAARPHLEWVRDNADVLTKIASWEYDLALGNLRRMPDAKPTSRSPARRK